MSASHTIVELGDRRLAEVGDVATLIGPEIPPYTRTWLRNELVFRYMTC